MPGNPFRRREHRSWQPSSPAWTNSSPLLFGSVDIRPHLPRPEATQTFLDYILPRIREGQTFLVTEFSLVWYRQDQLKENVDQGFAERYGFTPGTRVWEVICAATETPFRSAWIRRAGVRRVSSSWQGTDCS